MSTVGAPKDQTTCSSAYEPNSPTRGGPAGATTRARFRRPRATGAGASETSVTALTLVVVGGWKDSGGWVTGGTATGSMWSLTGSTPVPTETAGDLAERDARRPDLGAFDVAGTSASTGTSCGRSAGRSLSIAKGASAASGADASSAESACTGVACAAAA